MREDKGMESCNVAGNDATQYTAIGLRETDNGYEGGSLIGLGWLVGGLGGFGG